ncbi:MAG: hypothetical protein AAGD43_06650 [Pseudomonadota bacterium]
MAQLVSQAWPNKRFKFHDTLTHMHEKFKALSEHEIDNAKVAVQDHFSGDSEHADAIVQMIIKDTSYDQSKAESLMGKLVERGVIGETEEQGVYELLDD